MSDPKVIGKHTSGPWSVGVPGPNGCPTIGTNYGLMVAMLAHSRNEPNQVDECNANAKLIAAAPDLLEALEQTISLAWEYSREICFDETVRFSIGYDYYYWELFRMEIHTPVGSWATWGCSGKYSAYGGPDGSMWFEKFATRAEAEEVILRQIDHLCPSYPTSVARAAIAKAKGLAQ